MLYARDKGKYYKDKADGTLVFTVIALPMLVIVMILNLGLAQINSDKNELNSYMQRSVQAGVSKVNAYGSLNKNSIVETVRNTTREQLASNNATLGNGGDHISSRFCEKKIFSESSGVSLTPDNATYFMEITLNEDRAIDTQRGTSRASNTLTYTGLANGTVQPAPLTDTRNLNVDPNIRMKVINVKAYINLRSYWPIPGQDPCQTHIVNVSAITLGSEADVDYDNDFTESSPFPF